MSVPRNYKYKITIWASSWWLALHTQKNWRPRGCGQISAHQYSQQYCSQHLNNGVREQWMKKQRDTRIMAYYLVIMNVILKHAINEWTLKHYAKWNRPDTKAHKLYHSTYMKNLEWSNSWGKKEGWLPGLEERREEMECDRQACSLEMDSGYGCTKTYKY